MHGTDRWWWLDQHPTCCCIIFYWNPFAWYHFLRRRVTNGHPLRDTQLLQTNDASTSYRLGAMDHIFGGEVVPGTLFHHHPISESETTIEEGKKSKMCNWFHKLGGKEGFKLMSADHMVQNRDGGGHVSDARGRHGSAGLRSCMQSFLLVCRLFLTMSESGRKERLREGRFVRTFENIFKDAVDHSSFTFQCIFTFTSHVQSQCNELTYRVYVRRVQTRDPKNPIILGPRASNQ